MTCQQVLSLAGFLFAFLIAIAGVKSNSTPAFTGINIDKDDPKMNTLTNIIYSFKYVKKVALPLSVALSLTLGFATNLEAKTLKKETVTQQTPAQNNQALSLFRESVASASITGVTAEDADFKSIISLLEDLINASNKHNLEGILHAYNPNFMSGDNMALPELKSLIQETWQSYPKIQYTTKLKSIRVNGDFATVETDDVATAVIDKPEAEGMPIDLPGKLYSESNNTLYLKRAGSVWEIMSDTINYEMATIRYGSADDIELTLETPEQVKSGESYSAIFNVEPQPGAFVIASINNQELIYPHPQVDDKFRPMNSSNKSVQRVLKANLSNRNEIVTATVGITRIGEAQEGDRPSLGLDGIATIVKRVNIIPTSKQELLKALEAEKLVTTSASGKIKLNSLLKDQQPAAATK